MCGIFGYCAPHAIRVNPSSLDRCRDALQHRGPDMAGRFIEHNLYLGFRRLAILDLSADGEQPMSTADGRYTIVFNGEIYNFLELRSELEEQGCTFRGSSDTEVLLQLYSRLGPSCLDKLNGMFAFAVYDKVLQQVFLARDRLGVKPLFLRKANGSIAFASEVCSFRELPDFSTVLDDRAIAVYFQLGIIPHWLSIYPDVTKLPAGSWAIIDLATASISKPVSYWELPPVGEEHGKSEKQWLDDIETLLWDATRIRLRSDVPLGVFLSGGIDSGLVAAAAVGQISGLRALTVGFPGAEEDETDTAIQSARHLGLDLINKPLSQSEGMGSLPKVMARFDEPFADGSSLPTFLICAEARKHFTVVLSGDAGDEVFGGYPSHVRAWQWRWLDRLPARLRNFVGAFGAMLWRKDSRGRRFLNRLAQPVGRFGLGGTLYPFQDWPDACFTQQFTLRPKNLIRMFEDRLPQWVGASTIDMSQRIDLSTYLVDDILVKVDRMSMAHGLEIRSPFLDYRLVELGLRIPSHLRVKGGQNKYLLRKLAERHLPHAVCRGRKRGFGIPLHTWLRCDSVQQGLPQMLMPPRDGHADPLTAHGISAFLKLCKNNPALTQAMFILLCYRWWSDSLLAPRIASSAA